MPYENMGSMPVPQGSWTGPAPAQPQNPEALVAAAQEMTGAAYRVQKHSWAPQLDQQIAYGNGFIAARTSPYFGQDTSAEAMVDMPNAGSPLGTEHSRYVSAGSRERPVRDDAADMHNPVVHRDNVLNTATHAETTGENPAPIFRYGHVSGR